MSQVRVRIAPSPTGFWHIGNTRTALLNFLFAKAQGGKFILRLEDTDRERLVPGAAENIIEAVNWLGLNYDEGPDINGAFGPYIQSQRLELYKKHTQQLLDQGLAYREEGAVRFKTTKEGKTVWRDLIGDKDITIANNTVEDFIILKSDGYPTYNFANVIDDHLMEISHVIRGPEFISSTPKHIMLYTAFGWLPPRFGHASMILGNDKSKLSKRHGAKPVLEFRQDGFLPEAIINYMALLGWTPPSGKEILSLPEMTAEFNIDDVNVASPIFDFTKLEWMNGEYIRSLSDEDLTQRLEEYLVDHPAKEHIKKLVPLVKERIKKLSDFVPLTDFIWQNPEYDLSEFNKIKVANTKQVLEKITESLEGLVKPWTKENFETTFQDLAKQLNLGNREMFQLVRLAVSGQLVTPPLFECMDIIGEEQVLARVKKISETFPNIPNSKLQ